ncbi:MAG: Kelch repeat-containing protein [Myxococcota bacterium]
MGIWFTQGCEAQQAGSMELIFSWPDGAPDFSEDDLYLRGELQVWPDGVDEEGNPRAVTQRFSGRSSSDASKSFVKLGGADNLTFDGLSYGINLGVVIEVYEPNPDGGPDPPGDLVYYGRSQMFVLEAGRHKEVDVPLEIQAAPGIPATPVGNGTNNPGERTTPSNAAGAASAIRLCQAAATGEPTAAESCDDSVVAKPSVTLYFEAPNATRALLANDAAFSLGLKEVTLKDLTPIEGTLYRYPGDWDLNAGLPEGTGDGLRSVYVKLENALGLQGKARSHAVILDTTRPTLSIVLSPEQDAYAPGSTIELLVAANEALSAPPNIVLGGDTLSGEKSDSGAFILTLPQATDDTTLALEVTIQDAAQNAASWSRDLVIDATPPALVEDSEVLSGGIDTLCAFEKDFNGSACTPGEESWSYAPLSTLEVSFELTEAAPERDSVTGAILSPTLRVGPYSVKESCLVTETEGPLSVSCNFTLPESEQTTEQTFEVSVSLRDAAQNESTLSLGSIQYSPSAPSAFALGQPVPAYNAPGCVINLSVGVLNGVPETVTLAENEGSGLQCERAQGAQVTPTTHPFTCTCSDDVSPGAHTFIAEGTDYFGRTWSSPLEATIIYDPIAPTVIEESITLTGGVDEECLFLTDYKGTNCEMGAMGWSFSSTDEISLSFRVTESFPALDPASGEVLAPPLRIGPFLEPSACEATADDTGLDVTCVTQLPDTGVNQDIEVSVTLRDLAGNEASPPLGIIRHAPQVPSAAIIGQPSPLYNQADCQISVSVGVSGGIPKTLELVSSAADALKCERTEGLVPTFDTHPFTCTCTGAIARGGHTLSATGTDYFDRPFDAGIITIVYVDPTPPQVWGPAVISGQSETIAPPLCPLDCEGSLAECLAFCGGDLECDAECDAMMIGCESEPDILDGALPFSSVPPVLLTQDDVFTVQIALKAESIGTDLDFENASYGESIDPQTSQVSLGQVPLTLIDIQPSTLNAEMLISTWQATIDKQAHASAEGPVLSIQGVLFDAVGNETLLSDALSCPTPTAILDFTSPTVTLTEPFWHVMDYDDLPALPFITSPDTAQVSYEAWPCPPDAGVSCFGGLDTLGSGDLGGWAGFGEAIPRDTDTVSGGGTKGQWEFEPDPDGILGEGLYGISAALTDAVGLPSACVGPPASTGCWLGVLEIDLSAPTIEVTDFEAPPIIGGSQVDGLVEISAIISDTLARANSAHNRLNYALRLANQTLFDTSQEGFGACDGPTPNCCESSPNCCTTSWAQGGQQASLHCSIQLAQDTPSGVYQLLFEASDATHEGTEATTVVAGEIKVDNTPPSVTQVTPVPELGALIPAGSNIQVSLTFTEPVVASNDTLLAFHNGHAQGPPTGVLELAQVTEGLATVHTWVGSTAPTKLSGAYSLALNQMTFSDALGNAHTPDDQVEAFVLDTSFPTVTGASLSVDRSPDSMSAQDGYAGLGDRVVVTLEIAEGEDWEPQQSQLSVGGLPMTHHPATDTAPHSWEATLVSGHEIYSGSRSLQGSITDAAGNVTELTSALESPPEVVIDVTRPTLNLATFVPLDGELAGSGQALYASLSFNEPVTIVSDSLTAKMYSPLQLDPEGPPDGVITLSKASNAELTATGHQWSAVVNNDSSKTPSGIYTIAPVAHDLAGNPYQDEAIEAFVVDTDHPEVIDVHLTVKSEGELANHPPMAGYAGIGDRIVILPDVEGEMGESWEPTSSWMSLDGVALTLAGEGAGFELLVTEEAHRNLIGERTLEGAIIDEAGNETLLTAALLDAPPEAWPTITIDARAPNLVVSPQLDRCDGYAPAVEADNRLHVKGDWDVAMDCPTSWGAQSCTDPASPEETRISAPIRMTFVLDEALNHDLSSVYVTQGDTIQTVTVDRCASEENKLVAWYTPTGEITCLADSCCDGVCGEGEHCGNCPEDCGACPETGCGNKVCEPYPYAVVHSVALPPSDVDATGYTYLDINAGDTIHWTYTGAISDPGIAEHELWVFGDWGETYFERILEWGEGVDQRFEVPGHYTTTAEILTDDGFLTYQVSIYVAPTDDTEDCESCSDDCGECACVPSCEGKTCGDDGCGGSCGVCGLGHTCEDDVCVNPGWISEDVVTIEVSDLAGNLTTLSDATLVRDLSPPEAPSVAEIGQITYERYPWGADGQELNSSRVLGLEGSVEPNANVQIYSGANPAQAQRLVPGALDGFQVAHDGSFIAQLLPGDVGSVYIQVQDRAGNLHDADPHQAGARASLVRDVSWTASLGGKVSGSLVENPHGFDATRAWEKTLHSNDAETPDDVSKLGQSDDSTLRTLGASNWHQLANLTRPLDRLGHAMAYDSARGVSVSFGGLDHTFNGPSGYFMDTWEYTGETWTEVTPAGQRPSSRARHAMIYDSQRGVTVLFGGSQVNEDGWFEYRGDTWEWDGLNWTERTFSGPTPPARAWHQMAYDSKRGVTVLFGGSAETIEHSDGDDTVRLTIFEDLWEYDGESWVERDVAPDPETLCEEVGGFWYECAIWQSCCGAYTCESYLNDEYGNCCDWGESPPECTAGCICPYGEVWDRLIGCRPTDTCNDPGVRRPRGRETGAMAYDPERGVIVMTGGFGKDSDLNDHWEWDGTTWIEGPEPLGQGGEGLFDHDLVYDPIRQSLVMFLGLDLLRYEAGDLEGLEEGELAWISEPVSDGAGSTDPSDFMHAEMIYDARRDRLVFYTGDKLGEWDRERLSERPTVLDEDLSPSTRIGHAMVYDPVRGQTLMCGGDVYSFASVPNYTSSATWGWDGGRWEKLANASGIMEPSGLTLSFDTHLGRVLAGAHDSSSGLLGVWEPTYYSSGLAWYDVIPPSEGPLGRRDHAAAYDADEQTLIIHGGANIGGTMGILNHETWLFDVTSQTWSEGTQGSGSTEGPGARYGHAMVYDPATQLTLLHGGMCPSSAPEEEEPFTLCPAEDLWQWGEQAHQWTSISIQGGPDAQSPTPRSEHLMASAPNLGGVLMMYGDGQEDIWLWEHEGNTWTEIPQTGSTPGARIGSALSWDTDRQRALLFGGIAPLSADLGSLAGLDLLWEWNPQSQGRPGQAFRVAWPYAKVEREVTFTSISLTWRASGHGYVETEGGCTEQGGVELHAWIDGRWTPLTTLPEGPDTLTWSASDPEESASLFFGQPGQKSLHFGVTPQHPNGCGPNYGRIESDYVAVTVHYRLPAESP